jgi:phosphoribosylglycinamide formyltransferase-1
MKNIVVLVSGGGTNLQALLDAQKTGILNAGRVGLVISSKEGAFALERAKNAGVTTAVLPRAAHKSPEDYGAALNAALKKAGADIVVLAGFMTILDKCVIDSYPNRIINIHPSLLPRHCGAGFYGLRVHESVLASGDEETGATVHFVNEVVDGGAIIMQKKVAVQKGDTPEMLQKRVMEQAEWVILPQAVQAVCASLS